MSYTYDTLSGSTILRADSHSQITKVNNKSLVSSEQFWGNNDQEGLYFDYESSHNRGYTTTQEGWNDYSDDPTEKMDAKQTTNWIEENIFCKTNEKLCVIQGYAGCGKTTFVRSIIQKDNNLYVKYYNFYIGYIKDSPEESFISSSLQSSLVKQIISDLKNEDGLKIYKEFMKLFSSDLSDLKPELNSKLMPVFCSENDLSLFSYAKKIHRNRNKSDDINEGKYRFQFYSSLALILDEINRTSVINNNTNNSIDIFLFINILWICSVAIARNQNDAHQIIIFDNLDIIDNHYLVADFIDKIRAVLQHYSKYRGSSKTELPSLKFILTVRKITYASISRFFEVGRNEWEQAPPDVCFLDVSALYNSAKVLKHKALVFKNHLDEYIPKSSKNYKKISDFLKEVINTEDEVFTEIRFSNLFNNNLRACANVMEKVISNGYYKQYSNKLSKAEKSTKKRIKSALWINSICTIFKDTKVLNSLGYNSSDSIEIIVPTTLSRLILTILLNKRLGQKQGEENYLNSEVSLYDIVNTLEKIPFEIFDHSVRWNNHIAKQLEDNYNKLDTQEIIVDIISKMLQRNDSYEETELWRRPLYYTHNAFPLSNIGEIKNTLSSQIRDFKFKSKPITSFCITEEGATFVEQIATHFEFYSVRYNNKTAVPLICISNSKTLNSIIERVYNQVNMCVQKQEWLMKYYVKKYNASKNQYLSESFHPRTENFDPQLHIVRTIYDHILYLNEYRNFIFDAYKKNQKTLNDLNICILKWIGKYLDLYRVYFYDKLKDTVGRYNNSIWLELKYLYWLIYIDDSKRGIVYNNSNSEPIASFITINRISEISFSQKDINNYREDYIISKDTLVAESMIIDED